MSSVYQCRCRTLRFYPHQRQSKCLRVTNSLSIVRDIAGLGDGDQSGYMLAPFLQSLSHFGEVTEPIVNTRYASEFAAHVIEDTFDDMRGNVEARHVGRCRATQVVKRPVRDAGTCIEPALAAGEI